MLLRLDLELGDVDFSTFIEQMQNILNYSADIIAKDNDVEKELRSGVLVIGHENDGFFVYCGKKMLNKEVSKLQAKIDSLTGLDLIEMARKSGKPLEYVFTGIDGNITFFSIKVLIEGKK